MLWPFRPTWRPMRRSSHDTVDLRWLTARSWSQRWYPQGIDLGILDGRRMLAVGWFRQDKERRHLASRVSFVDLDRPRHRDVFLAVPDADGRLAPARIHVGGLAWFGDRLFAAATREGVWEFDLGRLRRVRGEAARQVTASTRRDAVVAVRSAVHDIDLRCSFLGRVLDERGETEQRVLIGEYRPDDAGRIGEFVVPQGPRDRFVPQRIVSPGIPRLQGAVRWGDRHFVSQSNGMRPGVLWSGPLDALRPHAVPLPTGCEDLALDPERGLLWSLGEHPWRRVVRGIPLARLGVEHPRGERRLDG
ncbi:hypothetical protein [Microbacterium sp. XT11]|uniref:hypothetical protein n=1 Tax=Microbacterium sp. XT11 TaxID=367477 RepID=UPI000830BC26|nr:hypothetical protein [Microbacterium sp. XT11]